MTKDKSDIDRKTNNSKENRENSSISLDRRTIGRDRKDASFPVLPPKAELPDGYLAALSDIKSRIQQARLKTALDANTAMIHLYRGIGRLILERQEKEDWGAKVIDRLSSDLRETYPEMTDISSRNHKYMRALAAAWPEPGIVQEALAQIIWYHNLALHKEFKLGSQLHKRYSQKAITEIKAALKKERADSIWEKRKGRSSRAETRSGREAPS